MRFNDINQINNYEWVIDWLIDGCNFEWLIDGL